MYGSGSGRIALFSLPSQEYEVLPVEGEYPHWLSDGRRMVFNNGEKLLVLDVETGRVKEILARAGLTVINDSLAISRDDRTIYFGMDRTDADIWMVTLDEGGNR
jgi:hypothetical protein